MTSPKIKHDLTIKENCGIKTNSKKELKSNIIDIQSNPKIE